MRTLALVTTLLLCAACASDSGGPAATEDATSSDAIGSSDGAPTADAAPDPAATDWRARPIYMVMLDRFSNGDPQNDDLGTAGCFDPADDRLFHGGDLAGLAERAGYLEELGIGAVWITPLNVQVGCGYHGYWADYRVPDARAMEPRFGTDADFDAAIEKVHEHGIAMMLDMVVNHPGRNATIVGQRPNWFHPQEGCANLGPAEIMCPLSGLPDFAHELDEVADYITDVSSAWLSRFAVDGVRMDTAKHVPRDYFSERWFPRARAERPELFVVAEVFDASSAGVYKEYYDAGFDSAFHFAMRQGLIDVFGKDASTNVLADRVRDSIDALGLERALTMTLFLANHDVPRWSEAARGSPAEVLARYRLALAAMFTLPGIPQLYAGDELGLTGSWPENRRDMPSWTWTAGDRAGDHPEALPDAGGTFDYVQRLLSLRRHNGALWKGKYVELWRQNGGAPVLVYFRGDADNRIIVVVNNGTSASEIRFRVATSSSLSDADRAALADGTVLEELLGANAPATLSMQDGRGVVQMPARSVGIYRVPSL